MLEVNLICCIKGQDSDVKVDRILEVDLICQIKNVRIMF